jgi:PilZ domain
LVILIERDVLGTEPGSNVRVLRRPAGANSSAGYRLRVNWPANISVDAGRTGCTVINISASGACLSVGHLTDSVPLWLIVDRMAPISAMIVWREGDCVGLRFRNEQAWIEEASEQRFDPAAWLGELA